MVFAKKETTAVTPMTSTLVSLPWCAGIFSEDAVLTEIVAGTEMLLNIFALNEKLIPLPHHQLPLMAFPICPYLIP